MRDCRLRDIRVIDICERCDISRRTFYYHFQDKYDLLAWIVEGEFNSAGPSSALVDIDARTRAYENMARKKEFFKSVYSDPGISELSDYLAKYDIRYYEEIVKRALGPGYPTEEQAFSLKMFVYGGIYMSREWVLSDFKTDPAVLARRMESCLPGWLSEIIRTLE